MKPIQLMMILSAGIGIGFLCGAAVTIAHGSMPKFDNDQVVAQVGETTLTRGELAQRMLAESGTTYLDAKIRDKMIVAEAARRAGVTVSADELNQRVDESINFAESQLAKNRLLQMPRWTLEEELRPMVLLEKLLNITVSDKDVEYYYHQNIGMFTEQQSADLIEVATFDETAAQRAVRRLRDGEDPYTVAKQITTDDEVIAQNYDTGPRTRDSVSPPVANELFFGDHGRPLKKGKCTGVIESYTGHGRYSTEENPRGKLEYFVFYVKDMQPARTAPFNLVKDGARFYARAQKLNALANPWFRAHAHDVPWQRTDNIGDVNGKLTNVPVSLESYPLHPADGEK